MYIPKQFEIADENEALMFVESNAFGQLTSIVEGKMFATHMPFLISSDKKHLIGHIARQNPQHLEIENQEVLVTFLGPHEYISPSWYASSGVPTWNYQTVHIYGLCRILSNHETVKSVVNSLTQKYESGFSEPWQPNYNESMLEHVVAFEIAISQIQCKYKLGQNRSAKDQDQVLEKLESLGAHKMAEAIKKKRL
jgi:transcriptional regulator